MKLVAGPGVSIPNERSRALRTPLMELPMSERLILPVCPERELDFWQLVPDGRQVSQFSAAAICADAGTAVSVPVGGTIVGHTVIPLPGSGSWMCLLLDTDAGAGAPPHTLNRPSTQQMGLEEILRTATAAGLIDELDGVPLGDKLRGYLEQGITLLVCDAVCDDPYNSDNLCAVLENTEDVCDGLALAASACACKQTLVVTARAYNAGLSAARRLRERLGSRLLDVSGRYPIWPNLSTHRPFAGQLFGRVGAQVCQRLSRAVRLKRPPERVIITVSGTAVREPQNFSVLIGTPISKVLEQCAINQEGYRVIAVRSAINGDSVVDPDQTPVLQDTRCVLAMTDRMPAPEACVGCGRCSSACPAGVFPHAALLALQRGETAKASFYGLDRCIGCGACSVACPANIPVMERLLHAPEQDVQSLELWKNRQE